MPWLKIFLLTLELDNQFARKESRKDPPSTFHPIAWFSAQHSRTGLIQNINAR